jgi:GT2 family glycosyltransferase
VSELGKKVFPYLTVPFSPRLFANFCFIAQPATLIKRSAWETGGGLNEDLQMAFDYDLWWRLFSAFGEPLYCREFVAATRVHKDTKTTNHTEVHYRESIEVVKHYRGKVPFKWQLALPVMKMARGLSKLCFKLRK